MRQSFRWLALALILLGSAVNAEDLLHPSMAFRPSARPLDGQTIEVRFEIAKGYYLYRNKFRFSAEPAGVQSGPPTLPKGKEKVDETFGKVEVYYGEVLIHLPVVRNSSGPLPLTLNISSQGCADAGVCYPPQKQSLGLELPDPSAAPVTVTASGGNESGRIAQLLKNAELWLVILSFFGFGLLLALTPCVFPMLPILSGIIVGAGRDGHGVSHARGFALSLAYVLGMAITYAAAGVAAGLTGTLLSSTLQNPWVLGSFALIFIVLSLSMFGFYELQLPTFLQSKVSEEAAHLKGGSLPGVAAMGALSAIIVGPCVAAPLAGALLYIGQSGNALLGGMALFFMALGMGMPLLAIGLSAGTLLPKSGPWMMAVKKVFGVILLATALGIVAPVIPVGVEMAAWALLLIVPAIFLHAVDPLPAHARSGQRFWKGIGMVMLIAGAAMLVGALSGARDPWQPLSGLRSGNSPSESRRLPFERIRSLAELDSRIKASGKPVMLDFYADWCVSCKEMERYTFSDARVQQKLVGWTLLQADVTANSDEDKALLARFKLFGPPSIIFFDAQGRESEAVRVTGFQNSEVFLATLSRLN
ncbi:protein-disulfide reductase DsbD [Propionivibrio sp.]|uniref:protein-disulfide reductase DsbD n=1 Tax=Propionivibrio sp. TaxID=2212460 RepID=UPI00263461D2|nr:protein-disulfide reductase DsbD [Propionivibrio sp.]